MDVLRSILEFAQKIKTVQFKFFQLEYLLRLTYLVACLRVGQGETFVIRKRDFENLEFKRRRIYGNVCTNHV